MKKIVFAVLTVCCCIYLGSLLSCADVNTNYNSHFDRDGYQIKDTLGTPFVKKAPTQLKFFVEVSGSMNGFFRANRATQFKADLWRILSYYSPITPNVYVLTNDGEQGAKIPLSAFQTQMNTGAFVSTASTKVPTMLNSIINEIDADAGEVAILVSDMKYSPVGAAAPEVLMTQYSTDIAKILGSYGRAVSLICATSNFLDSNNNTVCDRSPYYYFIIGNQERVIDVRNGISTLLMHQGHFVDNIDSGFDFGAPRYSFGISNRCQQLDNEPTFVAYDEAEDGDTCTIKLKVNIEDYRWIIANEKCFREAFKVSATYGSECVVGKIDIDVKDITEDDKQLDRKAVATVELKIFNMTTDSEVLEWTLDLPDSDCSLFAEFFDGANDENDPSKSYSVPDFIRGMFYGGVVNKKMKTNYILISKEG